MGEDTDAPNYDPNARSSSQCITASAARCCGKPRRSTGGRSVDVSKFLALHGEDTYEQFLAHYRNTPTSSAINPQPGGHHVALNAYLLDNEPNTSAGS